MTLNSSNVYRALGDLADPDLGNELWVQVAPGDLRRVADVTSGDDMDGWCVYIVLEPKETL